MYLPTHDRPVNIAGQWRRSYRQKHSHKYNHLQSSIMASLTHAATSDGSRHEPYYIHDNDEIALEYYYIPQHYQDSLSALLIPHGTIVDRVEKLAYDISQDYDGQTIHLLCVLKGIQLSCVFARVSIFPTYISSSGDTIN